MRNRKGRAIAGRKRVLHTCAARAFPPILPPTFESDDGDRSVAAMAVGLEGPRLQKPSKIEAAWQEREHDDEFQHGCCARTMGIARDRVESAQDRCCAAHRSRWYKAPHRSHGLDSSLA